MMVEPIRVLHVDDEPDFVDLAAAYLTREDDRFDYVTATDPREALRRLAGEEVDCVISDFEMPTMDGLALLAEVRADEPGLPFILFTGRGSEEIASEAISAGVTDYLQKRRGTSQYEVLANRIVNAVEKHRAERSLHRREDRLETLLEHSTDSITILDGDGEVTYCSPSVDRQFGYDRDQLVDTDFGEHVHQADRALVADAIRDAGADGESVRSIEFRFRHGDGRWRWVNAVVNSQLDNALIDGIVLNWRDVTEQKRHRRELEGTNELLEAVIDASPAAILSYDLDGRVQLWNPAAEEIYGWSADEVMGDPLPMVPEGKTDEIRELHDRAFAGESIADLELRRATRSGELIDVSLSTAPVRDEDGTVIGNVSVVQDITDRKEQERELQRYETIIEALGDPVYALDADERFQFVNDAFVEVTGYPRDDLLGAHVSEVMPETELEIGRDHVRQLLAAADEPSTTWEAGRLTAEGGPFPCEHHMALLPFDRNGEFQGTAGVVRDISDRREHEEQLEEMTDRMQLALEGSNSWIWDWDGETDIATQTAVSGILGTDEETVTRPVDDFLLQLHPDDRSAFIAEKERALANDQDYHNEFRLIDDDEVRWIESRGQVYRGDAGESARIIGIATDVTEQKQRALERQWMMRSLDQSSESVFVSDPETGKIKFVNDTACEKLGYDRGVLLGKSVMEVQANLSNTDAFAAHIDRLRTGGHTLYDGRHIRRDGATFPVEVNTGLVEIEREEYLLGIARDVTHRKERERELQRQIEQLDEFASIVSHDLRNPLNVAKGHLDLAMEDAETGRLEAIDRSLDRMERLIDDLLALAREGGPSVELAPVAIDDVTHACWQTVDTVDAELRLETEATAIADRGRLQQLLENLIRNAVEHGGADVTVTVGCTDDGRGLYLEDDGPGIPASDRPNVFETGYTTNENGTGFGLAIVEKVAEAHGWDVDVTSGSRGGARFEVTGLEMAE